MFQITDRNQLPELFDSLELKGVGAEIGVDCGFYSAELRRWKGGKIYLIDPWVNNDWLFNRVTQRLAWGNFEIIRDFSPQIANHFPDNFFDWVYIDALHDYESVRTDLKTWHAKVKPGGIVAGHDYITGRTRGKIFGVKQAVDEFVADNNLMLMVEQSSNRFASWYYCREV